jgi:hypothetical protein
MPSHLLSEWMAFSELEPFGWKANLYGHGIVASLYYNMNKKKGSKRLLPHDFLPTEKQRNIGNFVDDLKRHLGLNKKS